MHILLGYNENKQCWGVVGDDYSVFSRIATSQKIATSKNYCRFMLLTQQSPLEFLYFLFHLLLQHNNSSISIHFKLHYMHKYSFKLKSSLSRELDFFRFFLLLLPDAANAS